MITFEELQAMFDAKDIDLIIMKENPPSMMQPEPAVAMQWQVVSQNAIEQCINEYYPEYRCEDRTCRRTCRV